MASNFLALILTTAINSSIEKSVFPDNANFVVDAVLTDLSEAFDCIAHDLLIAKLSAYDFSDTATEKNAFA